MAFIVIGATALGYFLIPFAMKYLQATTVSIYTNLQPVIASFVAIMLGQDVLTWDKPVAGVLVLLSAYIVTVVTAKEWLILVPVRNSAGLGDFDGLGALAF